MAITYLKLRDKFYDKGYDKEFYWLVTPPYPFILTVPDILIVGSHNILCPSKMREQVIKEVYSKEWEEWSTWIDYQKHK